VNTRRNEIRIDDVPYALTCVETDGGMYAFWYCQRCAATGTPNLLAPDCDSALQAARDHLNDHHHLVHGDWELVAEAVARG
jgi:hypothetical protein